MISFFKHHLDTIAGVGLYPMISFMIFFCFFLAMLWWVRRVSNAHIAHMAALPLNNDINQDVIDHVH